MRFDVRSESVSEFVPNNLVEFVGRKLLSPFPNSGSPYPVGRMAGRRHCPGGWERCVQDHSLDRPEKAHNGLPAGSIKNMAFPSKSCPFGDG